MTRRSARVVATEPVPDTGRVAFARFGPITVMHNAGWAPLEPAEVLIVRTSSVSAGLLSRMPRLKVIARTGVGLDNIDLEAVRRRRIPLLYAPDTAARPIAEGTLALLLAATKRLPELVSVVRDGRWPDRYSYEVADLEGAVLGVVGLGRVGSEVARLGQALGMRIVACDPHYSPPDSPSELITLMELCELFACADVVTLHCPLTDETRGMIGRALLTTGKPGKVLINASRGALVDEGALIEALNEGQLSAVGLDVFATEPPQPGNALVGHPRVICTPHTIGLSHAWNTRVFNSLADDVERVLTGVAPRHIANPEVLSPGRDST